MVKKTVYMDKSYSSTANPKDNSKVNKLKFIWQ
jgi:hypothetical protein